jgi:threonyl-tRNA synthetase
VIGVSSLHGLVEVNYARSIAQELRADFVRCEADFGTDPINSDKSRAGAKIAEAEKAKVHTLLVIGGRDPATAGPATSRFVCTAKATSARNRRRRLWRISWRRLKSGGRKIYLC